MIVSAVNGPESLSAPDLLTWTKSGQRKLSSVKSLFETDGWMGWIIYADVIISKSSVFKRCHFPTSRP